MQKYAYLISSMHFCSMHTCSSVEISYLLKYAPRLLLRQIRLGVCSSMNFSKCRLDFKKGIFKKSEQEYKLGKANRKKELKIK